MRVIKRHSCGHCEEWVRGEVAPSLLKHVCHLAEQTEIIPVQPIMTLHGLNTFRLFILYFWGIAELMMVSLIVLEYVSSTAVKYKT